MEEQFESPDDHAWDNEPLNWEYSPPKRRQGSFVLKGAFVVIVALICSVLGGVLGTAGGLLWASLLNNGTSNVLVSQQSVIETTPVEPGALMTPAQVYAQNVNSTVGITTSITTNYWGFQTTSAASGSGLILTEDGYILTNFHVVEGSNSITVSTYDSNAYEAQLIGYDTSMDIAVLKIDQQGLAPVILGDSDKLNVGESVIAIGNPLGELTFSLTAGAVSAKDRLITMQSGITMNLIQTDCAINSGNSGGALFNLYGEVVGITNAKYSSSSLNEASIDNIGFAIPINDAYKIAVSIIEKGYVEKPYLGISVTDVSAEMQSYGLPKGAAVRMVAEGSPALNAGLQVNDIITHVDGKQINGSSYLISIISQCEIGQTVTLTVYRGGSTLELDVAIGQQIQQAIAK